MKMLPLIETGDRSSFLQLGLSVDLVAVLQRSGDRFHVTFKGFRPEIKKLIVGTFINDVI